MRLGNYTPIKIDDVTFLVKLPWGRYKKLAKEQEDLPEEDPEAQIKFLEATLREVVVGVEGLEDAAGKKLAWKPELLDELPVGMLKQLGEAVFDIGNAANPTTPAATSPEPPES